MLHANFKGLPDREPTVESLQSRIMVFVKRGKANFENRRENKRAGKFSDGNDVGSGDDHAQMSKFELDQHTLYLRWQEKEDWKVSKKEHATDASAKKKAASGAILEAAGRMAIG